ncbi:hypothetical protein GCM10023224_02980 [Streptomonospora halophila]|uniref:HTH cro/C1-type domain-containing protein n=1 Tax=Streptomonospora halophila TaxID=427369 RepID=A0ABP9G454_9ACTN
MNETGFGANLAKLRELSGLTQRQLAMRIGGSASSLSRWESGTITPKRADVERLDETLSAGGRLVRTWETEASGSQLPPWMRAVGSLEDKALSIDTFTLSTVPGLVQSYAFAREVFRAGRPTATAQELDKLARARVERYERLTRTSDPFVTAVFPEFALGWAPEHVRIEQAKALLELAQRERTSIHIVPNGTLLLSVTSAVHVYRLGDGAVVAASDHGNGNLVYDTASHAARIDGFIRDALTRALPETHTVTLLEGMLVQ